MKTSDFYYDLPKELIAQDPLEDRSASRLMHLNKETGEYEHGHFRDILKYLKPGDCLVINDTKVIPARLYGSKVGTDAAIEILLLKRRENDIWETLVKPGKKCKVGTVISFGDGILTGEVVDTALYKRASAAGTGCRCKDRPCNPACRPWHLPSGESGGCHPASHAL